MHRDVHIREEHSRRGIVIDINKEMGGTVLMQRAGNDEGGRRGGIGKGKALVRLRDRAGRVIRKDVGWMLSPPTRSRWRGVAAS